MKHRLDKLLVDRGLAESRETAKRLVMAGEVMVKGTLCAKPSTPFDADVPIEVKQRPPFVSRGGEKLRGALDGFGIDPAGRVCLDIGASTGGFTDCLLQRGAAHVLAVDVGRGQLHWKLRQDPRVTVREGVNARYLSPADLGGLVPDLAVVDVSFISLAKVLPAVAALLPNGADLVTLIKPQFEAGRKQVGKGGVVRDPDVHRAVVASVREAGVALGFQWLAVIESPLRGPAGNIEFLAHWRRRLDKAEVRG